MALDVSESAEDLRDFLRNVNKDSERLFEKSRPPRGTNSSRRSFALEGLLLDARRGGVVGLLVNARRETSAPRRV